MKVAKKYLKSTITTQKRKKILSFTFCQYSLAHSSEGFVVAGRCSRALRFSHPWPVSDGQEEAGKAWCHYW